MRTGQIYLLINIHPSQPGSRIVSRSDAMKTEYDLSKMKSRKNPYAAKLKKSVTMWLSEDVIGYFKQMAEEAGVPYQSLINLYLRDCVAHHKKPHHKKIDISWLSTPWDTTKQLHFPAISNFLSEVFCGELHHPEDKDWWGFDMGHRPPPPFA